MLDRLRVFLVFPAILVVMWMVGSQLWRAATVQRIGLFARGTKSAADIVMSEQPILFALVAAFYLFLFAFCFIFSARRLRLTFGNRPEDIRNRRQVLSGLEQDAPSGLKPLWYGLAISVLIFCAYVAYDLATI